MDSKNDENISNPQSKENISDEELPKQCQAIEIIANLTTELGKISISDEKKPKLIDEHISEIVLEESPNCNDMIRISKDTECNQSIDYKELALIDVDKIYQHGYSDDNDSDCEIPKLQLSDDSDNSVIFENNTIKSPNTIRKSPKVTPVFLRRQQLTREEYIQKKLESLKYLHKSQDLMGSKISRIKKTTFNMQPHVINDTRQLSNRGFSQTTKGEDLNDEIKICSILHKRNFKSNKFPILKNKIYSDEPKLDSIMADCQSIRSEESPQITEFDRFENTNEEKALVTPEEITDISNTSELIPEPHIDYSNIFEDISKLTAIEKHLNLLYRPFVCAMDVHCHFNMYEVATLFPNSTYDPNGPPHVTIQTRRPFSMIKIRSSGYISSESLSYNDSRLALVSLVQILQGYNFPGRIGPIESNTVHASFSMPFKIDLEKLCEIGREYVSSNRATRPFITYGIPRSTVKFAVFPNGFVLALHSKMHSETRKAIAKLLPILVKCKNGNLTKYERDGSLNSDVSYKLLWERKLDDDKDGLILFS